MSPAAVNDPEIFISFSAVSTKLVSSPVLTATGFSPSYSNLAPEVIAPPESIFKCPPEVISITELLSLAATTPPSSTLKPPPLWTVISEATPSA